MDIKIPRIRISLADCKRQVYFIFYNQTLLSWFSLIDNKFGGKISANIYLSSLTHLDLSSDKFGTLVLQSITRLVKLQHPDEIPIFFLRYGGFGVKIIHLFVPIIIS